MPRYCATWAKLGECRRNPSWMLKQCPVACSQVRPQSTVLDRYPWVDGVVVGIIRFFFR